MKRLFAVVLALAMVLSLGVGALAVSYDEGEHVIENDVTDGIQASGDAFVSDHGHSISNSNGDGILASNESTVIVVEGNVSSTNAAGINASNDSNVILNDSNVEGGTYGIEAHGGAYIAAVSGTITGNKGGVSAEDENTTVYVEGTVTGGTDGVNASNSADVTVSGNVTGGENGVNASGDSTMVTVDGVVNGGTFGVRAENNSLVDIGGDVTSEVCGVLAGDGAIVSVEGSAIGGCEEVGIGIYADDNAMVVVSKDVEGHNGVGANEDSRVLVFGDVTGDQTAAYVNNNSEVKIYGDAEGKNAEAVYAVNSTVVVGGDATTDSTKDDMNAIVARAGSVVTVGGDANGIYATLKDGDQNGEDSTVTVEGKVLKRIVVDGDSKVYIGEIDPAAIGDSRESRDSIHFLIGGVDIGNMDQVTVSGDMLENGTIRGLSRNADGNVEFGDPDTSGTRTYTATKSIGEVISSQVQTAEVILKAADGKKITNVTGITGNGIQSTADGNNWKFTIDFKQFSGGMNNLILTLENLIINNPGIEVYTYCYMPEAYKAPFLVKTLEASEGAEAYDANNHGGITVSAESLGGEKVGSVKVMKDGVCLSEDDFDVYRHSDGSVSVLISNSYLMTLGTGEYTFTAEVNGTEYAFTLLYAET